MFCPNCAAPGETSQPYCRRCGMKLEGVAAALIEQNPSPEMIELAKRQRRMQLFGVVSLSIAGIIGLMLLLSQALYYKLLFLGPELLTGSAIGALILFLLASVFFFNYPKLFMKPRPSSEPDGSPPINKLLNDPPFEPASVTEHTTELLRRK